MLVDAPSDPFLTYDPVRASILKVPEDPSILDTAIQEEPPVGQPSSGEPASEQLSMSTSERVPGLGVGVAGSFRLTEPLAQGGLGDVWVGVQRSLDRVVAVKRLREDRLEEASAEQRQRLEEMFRQEALTTARLEHPNIVPVYSLGADHKGQALLGMKMVRGTPWDELVQRHASLNLDDFLGHHLPILIQVAQAVAYAHSQGVLHRDIKPQQVMVGEFGEVLLMDWGLAVPFRHAVESKEKESLDGAEGGSTRVVRTASGTATAPGPAGTPSFMAPEQAQGNPEDLGPWTDLYLLGSTLYYLLTGSPPHRARNGIAAMAKAARGELEPPQERAPERKLPAELCDLTLGVMAACCTERTPQTVTAFIEALQAYLSGATRRRRSQRLTEEVAEQLASSRCGAYSEFSHSLSRLREAETLWSENPKIPELRDMVLGDYAEAALLRGDLALARVQAVRLPAGWYRAGLVRRIDRALERQRTSEQSRRRALGALAVLALLFLLGGLHYLRAQRRAGERLLHERDAARAARAEAEGLMTFMLEDLWTGLVPIERTDLLTPVARRAADYYAARDVGESSPSEQINRGQAFNTVGEALHLQGDTQKAIEMYRRALGVFEGLLATTPQDPELLLFHSETALMLAQALNDVGDFTTSLRVYEDAQARCLHGLEKHPDHLELRVLLMQIQDGAGIVFYDRGDLQAAEERFQRAAQIGHEILRRDPKAPVRGALVNAEFHHAVVLMDTGQPARALVELERAFEISQGDSSLSSPDPLPLLRIIRARALAEVGWAEEGLSSLDRLAPLLERRVEEDPVNAERRYVLALLELERGAIKNMLGHRTAARTAWQRVVELVEPVRESTDHLYLLDSQVRALFFLGQVEPARPLAEKLLERGWTHQGFVELCGLHGVAAPL